MTMIYEWTTGYCEYNYEDPQQPAGNVKVTILHWNCNARDDAVAGEQWVRNYGTVDVSDQNRVYTLAALQAVPQNVMTGWVQQALNNQPEDTVADIEARLLAQWQELQAPASGGFSPSSE